MFSDPSSYQQLINIYPQNCQHFAKFNINTNVFRNSNLIAESFPLINTLYY